MTHEFLLISKRFEILLHHQIKLVINWQYILIKYHWFWFFQSYTWWSHIFILTHLSTGILTYTIINFSQIILFGISHIILLDTFFNLFVFNFLLNILGRSVDFIIIHHFISKFYVILMILVRSCIYLIALMRALLGGNTRWIWMIWKLFESIQLLVSIFTFRVMNHGYISLRCANYCPILVNERNWEPERLYLLIFILFLLCQHLIINIVHKSNIWYKPYI